MKIIPLLFCLLLLSACSEKTEPAVTQTFPPKLTFVEPEEAEEEEALSEEEEVPSVLGRNQVFPELTEASSFLKSTETESFIPALTFDGSEATAWAENGPEFGAGEWIEHQFAWPEELQEIWIFNGHGENPEDYAQISEISLSFSNSEDRVYTLSQGWNTIVLPQVVTTTFLRVTILNGDTRNGDVACISEIKLFNKSTQIATEQVGKDTVLKNMGALGDCSNITPEQAKAFATELEKVMAWAETTSEERALMGDNYGYYTGEALLFSGGNGIPVLYYDYDFQVVEELFITETDIVVWDGQTAVSSFVEKAGQNTNINWILPGLVYENKGNYYFGLTEYDIYGSGSFGLIGMLGFEGGYPKNSLDYVAFISHNSRGAYTYEAELADYLKMPYLSSFPTEQLQDLVSLESQAYFEFNGTNFYEKTLSTNAEDVNAWFSAIRQARIDRGYEQVTAVQSGEVVLAGLKTLASGLFEEEDFYLYYDQPNEEYD